MSHLGCVDDPPSVNSAVYALTSHKQPDENRFSFETDGTPFVIDNSATCIICNDRQFFVGELVDSTYQVTTSNSKSTPQKKGTIRVNIVDDGGTSHVYEIPEAIYDPESPFNIFGVPRFAAFFGSSAIPDEGTWVKSGATRSHSVWDNDKYERHFSHGSNRLPELNLNTGFGYFHSFCNRVSNLYSDRVHFAFSTACSTANDKAYESNGSCQV